jgi:hypothetical protein
MSHRAFFVVLVPLLLGVHARARCEDEQVHTLPVVPYTSQLGTTILFDTNPTAAQSADAKVYGFQHGAIELWTGPGSRLRSGLALGGYRVFAGEEESIKQSAVSARALFDVKLDDAHDHVRAGVDLDFRSRSLGGEAYSREAEGTASIAWSPSDLDDCASTSVLGYFSWESYADRTGAGRDGNYDALGVRYRQVFGAPLGKRKGCGIYRQSLGQAPFRLDVSAERARLATVGADFDERVTKLLAQGRWCFGCEADEGWKAQLRGDLSFASGDFTSENASAPGEDVWHAAVQGSVLHCEDFLGALTCHAFRLAYEYDWHRLPGNGLTYHRATILVMYDFTFGEHGNYADSDQEGVKDTLDDSSTTVSDLTTGPSHPQQPRQGGTGG